MGLTKEMVLEHMRKGAVVVNVLEEGAYGDIHIKGSINIPLKGKTDELFATAVRQRVGTDREVITHCTNVGCTAGPRAAVTLQARGFKAVDYPGGIEDWVGAGFPVEGKKAAVHTS